jgi:hypothetical protein
MVLRGQIELAAADHVSCPTRKGSYGVNASSVCCVMTFAAATIARDVVQIDPSHRVHPVPMARQALLRRNEAVPTPFNLSLAPGPV